MSVKTHHADLTSSSRRPNTMTILCQMGFWGTGIPGIVVPHSDPVVPQVEIKVAATAHPLIAVTRPLTSMEEPWLLPGTSSPQSYSVIPIPPSAPG
ncbi:hypothetical protein [Corynebacterium efficiens YS-314]|uniref:Uncharacterized protein n=1 Tax=Corynebacterium efficiens (strain DSM 44549 / YS-314 / AJ 12310 / JCM 11189 / NBRC 100395) TaxID=196164 RepID=Q8FM06_COREF|nr:hypothetical protein [Corynebacterium efficiens YS-314]